MSATDPSRPDDLLRLICAQCDGSISEDDRDALEMLLTNDAERQSFYLDYVNIHAELRWRYREGVPTNGLPGDPKASDATAPTAKSPTEPPLSPSPASRSRAIWETTYDFASNYWALSLVVSGLFFAILLLSMAQIVPDWKRLVPGNEPVMPSLEFVAHITHFDSTTWDKASDGNLMNRDLFIGDKLILKEGLAEVTYDSGARVLLEGSARYEIAGSNGGKLSLGRLRAHVEVKSALGFVVDTPTARIEDLGTEFGVAVSPELTTAIAVMDGKVQFNGVSQDGRLGESAVLIAGQGLEISRSEGSLHIHRFDSEQQKQLIAALPQSATPTTANLILNPGFEWDAIDTAPATNWSFTGGDRVKATDLGISPYSGVRQWQLQDTNSTLSQAVTITNAGDYELSMWIANRNSGNRLNTVVSGQVKLELLDDTLTPLVPVSSLLGDYDSPRGTYVQWLHNFSGVAAGNYTVRVSNGSGTGANQGMVDDFSLKLVPPTLEPAANQP